MLTSSLPREMQYLRASSFKLQVETLRPRQTEPLAANNGYGGIDARTDARYSNAVLVGGFIFVAGRIRQAFAAQHILTTLAVLDILEESWRWIVFNGPCKQSCCLFLYDDCLYWRDASRTNRERSLLLQFDMALEECCETDFIGLDPGPSQYSTCGFLERRKQAVIFGGLKASTLQNDVILLEMPHKKWITPTIKGKPPIPRWQHSCCVHNDAFYVFGGWSQNRRLTDINILRFEPVSRSCGVWSSPVRIGFEGISSCALAPIGSLLLILGGRSDTVHDTYPCFDTLSKSFVGIQKRGTTDLDYGLAAVTVDDGKSVILIGCSAGLDSIQRATLLDL